VGESGSLTASPSPDAEQALLGAMLAAKDIVLEAVADLEARDFLAPEHSAIFQALQDLHRGGGVDVELAANCLDRRGQLEQIGGKEYLQELLGKACAPRQIGQMVNTVRGNGLLRRLEQAGAQIAAEARAAAPSDAEDTLALAVRRLDGVDAGRGPEGFAPLADIMESTLDEIEAISNRPGRMTAVPTGFADLDSLTQGLHPGQLIVIAGRPAIGKSTLGLDVARSCSIKNGLTSAIFSLDQKRNEVVMRLNSAEARVALHHMRSGNMTDDDWGRLARRMGEVSAAPLFIDDTADLTFTQIRARCRRLRRKHDLRLAIIDTINMMTYGTRPFDNRYLEISEIARCLKQLAKELEIPIIAISQLNRGPEQRNDKRPMLHDLRDAGTLEDNADVVLLLHREDAYEAESPRAGEADLIVAKHRQGPTATITVAYQGHYSRFVDMQQS
jgi:replicative DNA helicase